MLARVYRGHRRGGALCPPTAEVRGEGRVEGKQPCAAEIADSKRLWQRRTIGERVSTGSTPHPDPLREHRSRMMAMKILGERGRGDLDLDAYGCFA
jgi:hypothetical protein